MDTQITDAYKKKNTFTDHSYATHRTKTTAIKRFVKVTPYQKKIGQKQLKKRVDFQTKC